MFVNFLNYVVSEDYVKISNPTAKYFMCLGLELGFGSQGAITTLNVGGVCMLNWYFIHKYTESSLTSVGYCYVINVGMKLKSCLLKVSDDF